MGTSERLRQLSKGDQLSILSPAPINNDVTLPRSSVMTVAWKMFFVKWAQRWVTGPESVVDENVAIFDGTSGTLIKDSGVAGAV